MYRTREEGSAAGRGKVRWEQGAKLWRMVEEMAEHGHRHGTDRDLLIGCSQGTDRVDELSRTFERDVRRLGMRDFAWCREHWPLDGVIDGSTRRMLEQVAEGPAVLVTHEGLANARLCFGGGMVTTPANDSWPERENIRRACVPFAAGGYTFVWANGALKTMAWQLFREFPGSSHVDVGHLFDGAFGIKDYGWLQRGNGPWPEPYFRPGGFADWVRSFIK